MVNIFFNIRILWRKIVNLLFNNKRRNLNKVCFPLKKSNLVIKTKERENKLKKIITKKKSENHSNEESFFQEIEISVSDSSELRNYPKSFYSKKFIDINKKVIFAVQHRHNLHWRNSLLLKQISHNLETTHTKKAKLSFSFSEFPSEFFDFLVNFEKKNEVVVEAIHKYKNLVELLIKSEKYHKFYINLKRLHLHGFNLIMIENLNNNKSIIYKIFFVN